MPLTSIQCSSKEIGKLKLVYLSLIAEKKNLLLSLKMIKNCEGVTLDIYGPVKDIEYWNQCRALIDQIPGKVNYKGDVIHSKVQEIFTEYNSSILLTKGENFGHALYESLSAGCPIITSNFTPWVNLQQQKAGWNIDISTPDKGISLLNKLCAMSADDFTEYHAGAHQLSVKYYSELNSVHEYTELFNSSAVHFNN